MRTAHGRMRHWRGRIERQHNPGMDREDGGGVLDAVFVHGAGAGGWEWAIWQRVFTARGWNALGPDLVAADDIARTRIEDYQAQVRDWCKARAAPHVLIGASLGGLLALSVAAQVRPAALVLINPLPPAGIAPHGIRTDYPDVVPWGRRRSLAGTRASMPDADDAACLHAFRRWRDESGAVLRTAALGVTAPPPRCAVLVVASACDTDVAPVVSRAVAEQLGAELRLLHDASHVGALLGRGAADAAAGAAKWCAATAMRQSI